MYASVKPLPVSSLRYGRSAEVTRLPDGRLDGRSPGLRFAVNLRTFPGSSTVVILEKN